MILNGHIAQSMRFFGAYHEHFYEDGLTLSAASMLLIVSGKMKFMRIFAGFPGQGASNDSGVVDNINFQCFLWLCFRKV